MKQVLGCAVVAFIGLAPTVVADEAHYTAVAPVIDGAVDAVWAKAEWQALDQHIVGGVPEAADFSGRYKLLWDKGYLYVLADITDDVLYDSHPNPRDAYWDDDCLEIFVDEDASGGNHLNSHNAFAYHIALDGNVADMGEARADGSSEILLLNDHARNRWARNPDAPHSVIWEVAVKLYSDSFDPRTDINAAVDLVAGKQIGFMLAYCDNDGSETREHFMGSHAIEPVDGDKNLGYITASVFGKLTLVP